MDNPDLGSLLERLRTRVKEGDQGLLLALNAWDQGTLTGSGGRRLMPTHGMLERLMARSDIVISRRIIDFFALHDSDITDDRELAVVTSRKQGVFSYKAITQDAGPVNGMLPPAAILAIVEQHADLIPEEGQGRLGIFMQPIKIKSRQRYTVFTALRIGWKIHVSDIRSLNKISSTSCDSWIAAV